MAGLHRGLVHAAILVTLVGAFGINRPAPEFTFVRKPILVDRADCSSDLFFPPSDERCWTELAGNDSHIPVAVPRYEGGETLLMLTVQDAPHRSAEVTLIVEQSSSPSAVTSDWRPAVEFPEQPPYPVLPPSSATTNPFVPINGLSREHQENLERWFLPTARQRSPIDGEREPIITLPILTYGRVRIVMDETIAWNPHRSTWCRDLAARLNNVLIPRVESVLGPVADRLTDGTLTVVVTPQVRAVGGGDSTVAAFVLATDFRVDLDRPEGHSCDAIYLHPELSPDDGDAILVHELTHAAQFCALRRHYGSKPWPLQDWQIEGTAHAAEVLLTHKDSNITDRLRAFHRSPEQSPLVVLDAAVSGRWRDPRCRGATCSFFTWAAQRFGLETIAPIVTSPTESDDPWLTTIGQSWPDVQRAWLISVATAHETRRHAAEWGQPLTVNIDGGATAFVVLPTRDAEATLSVTSRPDVYYRLTLLRDPRHGSTNDKTSTLLLAPPWLPR